MCLSTRVIDICFWFVLMNMPKRSAYGWQLTVISEYSAISMYNPVFAMQLGTQFSMRCFLLYSFVIRGWHVKHELVSADSLATVYATLCLIRNKFQLMWWTRKGHCMDSVIGVPRSLLKTPVAGRCFGAHRFTLKPMHTCSFLQCHCVPLFV